MRKLEQSKLRMTGFIAFCWVTLVSVRVAARVIAVGSGARGMPSLIALTASVNAYWILAGPTLAWLHHVAAQRLSRARTMLTIMSVGIVIVLVEPVWYRVVLALFNGHPLAFVPALLSRLPVNALIVALIGAAGFLADQIATLDARRRLSAALESTLVDAELQSLTLQLQPHFLFNTLQLAAETAFDDIGVARAVVSDLQTLLRRSFEFEERSLVRVAEEMDFLESYIAIQRRRFGARLTVETQIDPITRGWMIPPLLLQPLVENSIQHGIGPLARDGRIVIRIAPDLNGLRIEVKDNGAGISTTTRKESSRGLGLSVTRRRLEALFPGRHSIELRGELGRGCTTTIGIPQLDNAMPNGAIGLRRNSPEHSFADDETVTTRQTAALTYGSVFVVGNVVVTLYLLAQMADTAAPDGVLSIAPWIPAQLLLLALAVVLWHVRGVRRWLKQRTSESDMLQHMIAARRANITTLRTGKQQMLAILQQLMDCSSANEFDQTVVASSERIRSLLSHTDDERSSLMRTPIPISAA